MTKGCPVRDLNCRPRRKKYWWHNRNILATQYIIFQDFWWHNGTILVTQRHNFGTTAGARKQWQQNQPYIYVHFQECARGEIAHSGANVALRAFSLVDWVRFAERYARAKRRLYSFIVRGDTLMTSTKFAVFLTPFIRILRNLSVMLVQKIGIISSPLPPRCGRHWSITP